ncbi:MAG: caspase family protein, partial [Candidatus Latescibacterota bacterium]
MRGLTRGNGTAWLLALAFLAVSVLPSHAAQRWALLVGISDYTDGDRLDLKGPANDVELMEELLISRFGFAPDHIRKLVDGQATRAGIAAGLEDWLAASARPEDTVFLYYSGHGSQVPDLDGDEPDGRDEVLCPADVQIGVPGNELADDELNRLLGAVRATDITVILDACHAGTGTRDLQFGSTPLELRYADLHYPQPAGATRSADLTLARPDGMDLPGTPAAGTRALEGSSGFTMIASCAPDETSASSVFSHGGESVWSGVLTYSLVAALRKADSGTTYSDLMSQVERDVKTVNRGQTPQVEGNSSRGLFSNTTQDLPARACLRVVAVSGTEVEMVSAGQGGETPGSIYRVLSPGTGEAVGRVKVTRAFGRSVDGELMDGQGKVQAPALAMEEYHAMGTEKLYVHVGSCGDGDVRREVVAGLGRLDGTRVAPDTAYADLQVDGSAVFDVFSSNEITLWTLEAGVRGPEVKGTNAREALAALRPQLENAYAVKRLSRLDNPSPPFRVAVWATKTPKPGDKRPRFQEMRIGDPVYFHFRSDRDAYLTLLNVGAEGSITILYPNQFYPNSRVVANKTYTIPSPEMGFELHLSGPPGQEMVKAIATEFAVDLSSLTAQQVGGFRSLAMDPALQAGGRSVVDGLAQALQSG